MTDGAERLNQCMEHIFWDMIDIHGISRGRKNELTFVTSLIVHLTVVMRLRMQDIARIMDVSRSTVTDYVDYLETRGYVQRVRGDDDHRDIYVEPTEKGREWIAHSMDKTYVYTQECISRLTPEEREIFIQLLIKFIGDYDNPPFYKMLQAKEKSDS